MKNLYLKILRSLILSVAFGIIPCATGAAVTNENGTAVVKDALVKVQSDIERDTVALIEFRAMIDKQRRPLAERLDALQKKVKMHRADVKRVRRLRLQGEKEQAILEADAVAVEEEGHFLTALFTEYARAMETRVGVAEAPQLIERLRPIQEKLTQQDLSDGFANSIQQLLTLAAEFNEERLGGNLFEGVALDAAGIEQLGRFAVFGPTSYFAVNGKDIAGLTITEFGASQPVIYDKIHEDYIPPIFKLVMGEVARVPLDVTEGDAIKVAEAKPTLVEHVKKGGLVMYPLLIVALTALILGVWKTIELASIRLKPEQQLHLIIEAVKSGNIEEAKTRVNQINQPVRMLVEEAIEHRDSPRDHLEEIMHEHVLAALPRLERNLGTLAVLGGIAPLLGLLGTVTGMIHTFQLVTVFGSGDAKLLSGGISEALVTTETGLAIAIPILLVHAFLSRRARGIIGQLEFIAVSIVNDLKARSSNT